MARQNAGLAVSGVSPFVPVSQNPWLRFQRPPLRTQRADRARLDTLLQVAVVEELGFPLSLSGGLAVVILQHPAQTLSTLDRGTGLRCGPVGED